MSNRSALSEIKLTFQSLITNTLTSGAASSATIQATLLSGQIADGINSGQANRAWASEDRALGDGGNETLDLYTMSGIDIGAGDGLDGLGQACLFEEVYAIIIKCETGPGTLEIAPGTANPLNAVGTHSVATGGGLNAGGIRAFIEPGDAGIDLSATKKNVKFSANGGALTYSIYILGRHDDDESTSSSSLSSSSSSSVSSSSSSSSSSSGP